MARLLFCLSLVAFLAFGPLPEARASAGFSSEADALLKRHLASGDFSGVVLVTLHGKPLLRKAYGLANREWSAPVTLDTEFRIGSTTKQFTAAAILMLRDAGQLSLDQHIADFVEDIPDAWKAVTLRQLLDHTSGIPDYTQVNGFIRTGGRMNMKPADLLALVKGEPLEAAPGTKFKYDNTGYLLLGMVVEKVSGVTYDKFLSDRIFKPLGLASTAYDDPETVVPRRASGYEVENGHFKNARLMTTAAAYSAGGLRSTADDLQRWNTALHGGKLLRLSSVSEMFTDRGHGYGFGSFIETRQGHRLWDHGGNLTGFSSAFEFYPDDDLLVVVLTNVEGTGSEHIAKELALMFFAH